MTVSGSEHGNSTAGRLHNGKDVVFDSRVSRRAPGGTTQADGVRDVAGMLRPSTTRVFGVRSQSAACTARAAGARERVEGGRATGTGGIAKYCGYLEAMSAPNVPQSSADAGEIELLLNASSWKHIEVGTLEHRPDWCDSARGDPQLLREA